MDRDFLLRAYGQCWGAEAGPFNLSVENKYLEYMLAWFFQENFPVAPGADILNIGIGAGYWDRYLSYQLRGGSLTSADILPDCCRALRECLANEGNPNPVTILCADAMTLTGQYDIVTVVGSTLRESGRGGALVKKALDLLKPGGSLFLQTLSDEGDALPMADIRRAAGAVIDRELLDDAYGFRAHYWKLTRP